MTGDMIHDCPHHHHRNSSNRRRRQSEMVLGSPATYVLEAAPGVFYEGPFEPDLAANRQEQEISPKPKNLSCLSGSVHKKNIYRICTYIKYNIG